MSWFDCRNLLGNRFDMFDDLKEQDKEWLKGFLKDTQYKFKNHVDKYRGNKITVEFSHLLTLTIAKYF